MKHFNFTIMKTFNDLKFKPHPNHEFDAQAVMFFDNGYGISVITGKYAYTNDENPYECAVLKGNKEKWIIAYDTPITNDVIGYCDKEQVTKIMKQIQEL